MVPGRHGAPPPPARLRGERDARDDARAAVLAASARVRVADADWDGVVTDVSGRAWLASGKDAGRLPYAALFGGVRAADAIELGPHKATVFGGRLLAKARELAHPDLVPAVERLAVSNEALAAAAAERDEATEKAAQHDVRRRALVREVEALAARTEVEILTRFPGRRDLVRAVLADPEGPRRRRGGERAPTPVPGGPDADNPT